MLQQKWMWVALGAGVALLGSAAAVYATSCDFPREVAALELESVTEDGVDVTDEREVRTLEVAASDFGVVAEGEADHLVGYYE